MSSSSVIAAGRVSELAALVENADKVVHFVGACGAGVSALLQYRLLGGGKASGSDRSFDRGEQRQARERLETLGARIYPQDGSGVGGADLVVASTAVEADIADLVRARELQKAVVARADLLAHHVGGKSLAVAGTSGKSTVTAMIFEILRHAGRDPGLIAGGRLHAVTALGLLGNAWRGSGPLVFEADESDGSLVRHQPEAAVVLNLQRDHMEPEKVLEQFITFRARTRGPFAVGDDPNLSGLRPGAVVFGFGPEARVRAEGLDLRRDSVSFRIGGQPFSLPLPGLHNARNALAAAALCHACGISWETAAEALAAYHGVLRRFERAGSVRGVDVIDDFAHNPHKLGAVLLLAASRSERVFAYFQPHGYAPTRFQWHDLVATFAAALRPADRLWIAPIYYSGGTVAMDVSSEGLVRELHARGAPVELAPDRGRWIEEVAARAAEGDTVLVLGARDPTLPELARAVVAALA
ncbi:MAG: UDP-N-acetylmuramate--alanine ligase [Planctomycetes bacterium]|nr:UDP-N-acetylmuramate--alanine ligase [Planctomycetota bacterium]